MNTALFHAMEMEVRKIGVDALERYRNEVAGPDLERLNWLAVPGVSIAWEVGREMTNFAPLGIHPQDTSLVRSMNGNGCDDRFFVIQIGTELPGFRIQRLDPTVFSELAMVRCPYRRQGPADGFSLYRSDVKIGRCEVIFEGRSGEYPQYRTVVFPDQHATDADIVALRIWSGHAVTELSETLFAKVRLVLNERERFSPWDVPV